MKFKRLVGTVDSHVEGMPARVVVGGIPNIPGTTMLAKRDYAKQNLDPIRTALLNEPRGHNDMFLCILTSPVTDRAAFGVLYGVSVVPEGYINMCVHGSMGVATVAVETGIVEPREPVTKIIMDTVAGTVYTEVNVENGKAKSVTLQNVPSFFYKSEVIEVPAVGRLSVDIAYGGNFYTIVDAASLGIRANIEDIRKSEVLFSQIRESVHRQVVVQHPEIPDVKLASGILLSDTPLHLQANARNILVGKAGFIDRSPCGTGTSAKMATLYAKGKLKLGETFVTESILGTVFHGRLTKEVDVGGIRAVLPEVTGRAFITGIHQFVIDEDDPFKYGFKL